MRILVANVASAEPVGPAADFLRQTLVPLTQRNADLVRAPDTELVFRFSRQGEIHPAFAEFRHLSQVNAAAMYTAVRQAEAQGYDAAILGCFGDPFLRECRAGAAIPVTGFGEASMLLALTLGDSFGIVSPSPMLVEPIRQQVAAYGLAARLAGVRATGEPAREQEMGLRDASRAIEHFEIAARGLIAAGADVIIPGCGLLSPALRLAPGAESRYPRGCVEVDGIPVVDVVAASVLAAQAMTRLGTPGALRRGRNRAGAADRNDQTAHDEGSSGHWDCT